MTYTEFSHKLNNYIYLYKSGLKKRANSEISAFVNELKELESKERDSLLNRFLFDCCDGGKWNSLMARGNGCLPYALNEYIFLWITPRCDEKKMPECRWYYEIYVNHEKGYLYALKYLEYAFSSNECDQKTIDLLFDYYLEILKWGAHHFPEGCIIKKETINNCFCKCEEILKNKHVSAWLVEKMNYYKTLYECYKKYVNDGKIADFNIYLQEAKIDF